MTGGAAEYERQIGELTLAYAGNPKTREIRLKALGEIIPEIRRQQHRKAVCEYWGLSPLLYDRLDSKQIAVATVFINGEGAGKSAAWAEMNPQK